jgi:manganese-dependent inorganic pyrophosphatase
MSDPTNTLFVIGHLNPDTDAICSAVGYAWLLDQQINDRAVMAARAGQLNPQTTWIFKRIGCEPPMLLQDASPRFSAIAQRLNTATPDAPLHEAWTIANRTGGVAPIINPDGTPFGLVTVMSLFAFMGRTVGIHNRHADMLVTDLLSYPCREACDTEVPQFQGTARIRDLLPRILREERNEFWVVDEKGCYLGICRQRDALRPPRLQLVLVDHNEAGQALGALDEGDVVEILDHHRLGNLPTVAPIKFMVDTVGSTCTLVSERIDMIGLSAPPNIAGLLLAGLISDTLLLTSPTTTDRDRAAAERLSRWAFLGNSPLAGETFESYGRQILEAGVDLVTRSPLEIVKADFKLYDAGGLNFGVSQVEFTSFAQLHDHLDALRQALTELKKQEGLDFALLMATNVVSNSSRLIMTDDLPQLDVLPYPKRLDGTRDAPGLVSRKKQLMPQLLGALEG